MFAAVRDRKTFLGFFRILSGYEMLLAAKLLFAFPALSPYCFRDGVRPQTDFASGLKFNVGSPLPRTLKNESPGKEMHPIISGSGIVSK